MVESAGAGASAHDAFASSSIVELEEAIAAKRAADVESEPARRIAALETHVQKQKQHLALAEARLADEKKEQGL